MIETRIYTINVEFMSIETAVAKLEEPVNAAYIANLSKQYNEYIIGIPDANVSPCSLALAYLYTLEDLEAGNRVKNKAILTLMNLLGLRQARDVVEKVEKCKVITVIGRPGETRSIIEKTLKELGIKEYKVKAENTTCTIKDLENITIHRIEKI